MNRLIVILFSLVIVCPAWGQPALKAGPVLVPGGPAMGNAPATPQTNAPVNPHALTVSDVAALLQNLQGAVQQALPAVAAFDNTFVFTNVPANMTANYSVNLGRNFAVNYGANYGVNYGANLATPTQPNSILPGAYAAQGSADATLRGMVVLQSELEQILPVLSALNGRTNVVAAGLGVPFMPGSLTNLFGP